VNDACDPVERAQHLGDGREGVECAGARTVVGRLGCDTRADLSGDGELPVDERKLTGPEDEVAAEDRGHVDAGGCR
jgi:hypothetical protein